MTEQVRPSKFVSHQVDRARVESVIGQMTTISGRIRAAGVGEFITEVDFPVVFYEEPMAFPGCAVLDVGRPENEHFPYAELSVVGWKTRPSPEGSVNKSSHYIGAQVAVRTAGRSDQTVHVAYMFMGGALSSIGLEG